MAEEEVAAATLARFDVHPSVVFQLGEHLISDVVQALVELVKNAYDADASYAKITIDTRDHPPEDSAFPDATGFITIEDDGHGMSRDQIVNGWLVISDSAKRALKKAGGTTTRRKRTPLGDKGLGRLGVQRLGRNIEIATRYTPPVSAADEEQPGIEHYLAFSWDDFVDARRLSEVPIRLTEAAAPTRERGTRILISGLRDLAAWQGDVAFKQLRDGLSQMLSPYEKVDEFRVYASIDGTRLDLAEIGEAVRRTAQVHYDMDFDGSALTVNGQARLTFFRPPSGEMRRRFRDAVESDQGQAFLDFLTEMPGAMDFRLHRASRVGWFVDFSQEFSLTDLDGKSLLADGSVANPGPFRGEVDGFNLGAEAAREALETVRQILGSEAAQRATRDDGESAVIPVFSAVAEYNEYIKSLSGIRVYRDGFGIRVDHDWLGLASERTSGKSYYSLRPSNTLGYIGISARGNANLAEKTDREGFQVNSYYQNFFGILQKFVTFSSDVQELLRRGWVAYEKRTRSDLPPDIGPATPGQIASEIQETMRSADDLKVPLQRISATLDSDAKTARRVLKDARSVFSRSGTTSGALSAIEAAEKSVAALADRIEEAQDVLRELERYLVRVADANPLSSVLANEITGLQERLDELYSMVGLGLTAEALSHELQNIADQLASRTQKAMARVRKLPRVDARLVTYMEYVQSAVAALRKQLSHLAPSLKYVRNRREPIALPGFISDLIDFHRERFSSHEIQVDTKGDQRADFTVEMNRGKLTQIFDNLLLNSEYWLRESLRDGNIKTGLVTIETTRPFVRVTDNGRGISKTVEHRLFSPFVTAKRRGEGRGLGLFITRQLLDSDGCSIQIAPQRNEFGNLSTFEIDFTGALRDSA